MNSPSEEAAWQPSTDAQALAKFRSLTRAYIRGELSHSAFVMQFGVDCLTHDLATPRPPDTFSGIHQDFSRCPTCNYPVPRSDKPEDYCELGHCPGGEHDGVSCHLCNADESEECQYDRS